MGLSQPLGIHSRICDTSNYPGQRLDRDTIQRASPGQQHHEGACASLGHTPSCAPPSMRTAAIQRVREFLSLNTQDERTVSRGQGCFERTRVRRNDPAVSRREGCMRGLCARALLRGTGGLTQEECVWPVTLGCCARCLKRRRAGSSTAVSNDSLDEAADEQRKRPD